MAAYGDQPVAAEKRLIPADAVRQGDIILRTPLMRAVFIGGLIGAIILGIVITFWANG